MAVHIVIIGVTVGVVGRLLQQNKPKSRQLKRLKHKTFDQSKKLLSKSPDEALVAEREVDSYIAISGVAILSFLATPLYPALFLIGMATIAYIIAHFTFRGLYDLLVKKRITIQFVNALFLVTSFNLGYYLLDAIDSMIFSLTDKLLLLVRRRNAKDLSLFFNEFPQFVWLIKDSIEYRIPLNQLQKGDIIAVSAGEVIAVDGKIYQGQALIDERILNGEVEPIEKTIGAEVFGLTTILSGHILVKVDAVGGATVAAKIAHITENMTEYITALQTGVEKEADRIALPILGISGFSWSMLGAVSGVASLNSAVVQNLRISAPLGMLSYMHLAYKQSVLVKDARVFEVLPTIDTFVFDKTGTLTLEKLYVTDIYSFRNYNIEKILWYAASVEARQTHPIAKAILEKASVYKMVLGETSALEYKAGFGLQAAINKKLIHIGSLSYMELENIHLSQPIMQTIETCFAKGNSTVIVAVDRHIVGIIELRPSIHPDAYYLMEFLKKQAIQIYIISGDHHKPTVELANTLGITNYFAEISPEEKGNLIQTLKAQGKKVAFMGDGMNDVIALKSAHLSISLADATPIATETASVLLLNNQLSKLKTLYQITEDYHNRSALGRILVLSPGFFIISGIFFMKIGVVTTTLLFWLSLIVGIGSNTSILLNKDKSKNRLMRKALAYRRKNSSLN